MDNKITTQEAVMDQQCEEVCGFEFELGDGQAIRQNDEAFWILCHLQQKGCVYMEVDDGPHEGIKIMDRLQGEYWKHVSWDEDHFHLFVETDEFKVPQCC